MSKRTRRTFSPEFSLKTAQLFVDQDYSHEKAAKTMEVGFSTICKWVKQINLVRKSQLVSQTPMTPAQLAIGELKKQLERTELEKEILKNCGSVDAGLHAQFSLVEKLSKCCEVSY